LDGGVGDGAHAAVVGNSEGASHEADHACLVGQHGKYLTDTEHAAEKYIDDVKKKRYDENCIILKDITRISSAAFAEWTRQGDNLNRLI